MMRQQHRLRPLQMRIARHRHIEMFRRLRHEHTLKFREPLNQDRELIAHIQPHIERHLIVPAPARVQLSRRPGRSTRSSRRSIAIWISSSSGKNLKPFPLQFVPHRLQAAYDRRGLAMAEHTGFRQRLAMGDAAADILRIQPLIHRNGSREGFD
jgi:hypothetical protein